MVYVELSNAVVFFLDVFSNEQFINCMKLITIYRCV